MDDSEEAEAYHGMDHSEVDQKFVDDLLAAAIVRLPRGSLTKSDLLAVDLGTGPALQPILLCRRRGQLSIVAVDASAAMLNIARRNVQEAGLDHRIALQLADVKRLPLPTGRFPIVFSNSLLHHVPHPVEALREAWRVTAHHGLLFFRDLLRPNTLDQLDELVRMYSAGADSTGRRLLADSLHAALTMDEVSEMVATVGGESSDVKVTSDRHWTWAATKAR